MEEIPTSEFAKLCTVHHAIFDLIIWNSFTFTRGYGFSNKTQPPVEPALILLSELSCHYHAIAPSFLVDSPSLPFMRFSEKLTTYRVGVWVVCLWCGCNVYWYIHSVLNIVGNITTTQPSTIGLFNSSLKRSLSMFVENHSRMPGTCTSPWGPLVDVSAYSYSASFAVNFQTPALFGPPYEFASRSLFNPWVSISVSTSQNLNRLQRRRFQIWKTLLRPDHCRHSCLRSWLLDRETLLSILHITLMRSPTTTSGWKRKCGGMPSGSSKHPLGWLRCHHRWWCW